MFNPPQGTTLHSLLIASLALGLFLPLGREVGPFWVVVVTWLIVCIAADGLWHMAPDGTSSISMAPAAYISALATLPVAWGVGTVALASAGGALFWRRKTTLGALVRGGATLVSALVALAVLAATGSYVPVTSCEGCTMAHLLDVQRSLGIALAGSVFILCVQALRAITLARARGAKAWEVWRTSYGYETGLVTSAALVVVALLTVFCYVTVGYRGILLCVMPLLFVREGSRRYVALQATQTKLILTERLAAKGEMAAEIGHELNNYLAAISGRAQLLGRSFAKEGEREVLEVAERIRELATRMAELSKGLMDFSHRGVKRTAYGVNELIEKTVEFVRPQTRFQAIRFTMEGGEDLPTVEMDPGQIQQVLLTLFGKIVEGMGEDGAGRALTIRTFDDKKRKTVAVEIRARGIRFDAAMESDPDLGTVHRILESHQGRLETRRDEDEESFRLLLPAA